MSQARYFFGLLVVVFVPPAIVWWLLVHPFVRFWRRVGAPVTLAVVAAVALGLALALYAMRGSLMGRDLGTHWALLVLAGVLFAPAVALAVSRRRHLTLRVMSGIPEVEGHAGEAALLTRGPYAVIRHPRYVEVVLATLAYAVFASWTGPYVVALLAAIALHAVVLLEERELTARFGQAYVAYARRVPRYLPRRRVG